mgnify:CR=1 FL=1|jgi:hypothetical protein
MTAIEFTKEEATALIQLIDIATKSAGLNVAEAATVLAKKIAPATQDAQTETPDISPKE